MGIVISIQIIKILKHYFCDGRYKKILGKSCQEGGHESSIVFQDFIVTL